MAVVLLVNMTPCCRTIYSTASDIYCCQDQPAGRTGARAVSIYRLPFQSMPMSHRLCEWIGTSRYGVFTSTLAMSAFSSAFSCHCLCRVQYHDIRQGTEGFVDPIIDIPALSCFAFWGNPNQLMCTWGPTGPELILNCI